MASIIDRLRALVQPKQYYQISFGPDAPTQVLNYTAKQLYTSQDNLQAVVNFLASSLAQLPLKVYHRDGENERVRDRESAAAKLLWRPNEDQTSYEFFEGLAVEFYVFGCVYVWIAPDADSDSGYQLRIIPSEWVMETIGGNVYSPDAIRVRTTSGLTTDIPKEEFVQFKTYSPGNPGGYISPISALRQTLSEQIEAGRFRRDLWKSSGRLNAQILRPANVQPWDDETRKKFATAFREAWGSGGSKAGSIPIMEDGMEIKPFNTSFKESQWLESVKLSREAVAAAYRVNPSLIWHSDTQTYASSKDNARALYAECLGPTIQMFQQRINSFLLPKVGADSRTYVIFDLTEKLKGSFEERAQILQSAVGGPWLTRNEARTDNDLPPIDGGDELIVPLNVTAGGLASPRDTGEKIRKACECESCKANEIKTEDNDEISFKTKGTEEEMQSLSSVFSKFLKRQAKSVIPKMGADPENFWDAERWNRELADDLEPVIHDIAKGRGQSVAEELGSDYVEELTEKYLRTLAEGRATNFNEKTLERLLEEQATEEPDEEHVFEVRENTIDRSALNLATYVATWAIVEATHQAESQNNPGIARKQVMKRWITGENPRPSHAVMAGEMVPVDATFSNGMFWPGDTDDPEEGAGCNCTTEVVIIRGG